MFDSQQERSDDALLTVAARGRCCAADSPGETSGTLNIDRKQF